MMSWYGEGTYAARPDDAGPRPDGDATPGKQTLTSSLSPARAAQGAASAGASFGATRTADPFWFAADATFAVGEVAAPAGPPGAAGPAGHPGAPLIVEDGSHVASNQMTKSEFLAEVHGLVPGEDVAPWRSRPSAALEQDVRKRVPGAASARSARDYLAGIAAQAQTHAAAGTGPKTPGPSGTLAAISGSEHATEFMRSGAMGEGAPLPTATRAGMESVFHHDFGAVRVHTSQDAQALAGQLDARAFTVGHQVAFAAGNYAPGTPVGDALLAHELAHVVQQHGAPSLGRGDSGALDADADQAATYAVSALHGGERSARAPARPGLRSGVGLQRCPGGGGGGGGGALTFSSASYTPGAGGAVTGATTSAQLVLTSAAYSSTGDVSASGGTDADAAEWDAGYLQTVQSAARVGHYVGGPSPFAPPAATTFTVALPANTRDGNPAGNAPWYDSANPTAVVPFTKTGSTITAAL